MHTSAHEHKPRPYNLGDLNETDQNAQNTG